MNDIYDKRVSVRINQSDSNIIDKVFHHGQFSFLFRKVIDCLVKEITENGINRIYKWMYRDEYSAIIGPRGFFLLHEDDLLKLRREGYDLNGQD